MATDIQDALLYVRENVSELRKLGKEWGLDQSEINSCVKKALSMKIDNPQKSEVNTQLRTTKFKARKTWSRCRCCLGICLGLVGVFVLVTGSIAGVLMYQADSIYPSKFLLPYAYNVMKTIRLAGIPLQNTFRIEKFYSSECIIDNPLFKEPEPDCELCRIHKSVKEVKIKMSTVKIHLLSYPLLHRDIQAPVHLDDVRKMVDTNKASLQGQNIECTAKWAKFASDLARDDLEEQILKEEKFSCDWDSKDRMFLSQIMRKLFPRPSVIPTEMEVALQKYFLIDGKGSSRRSLPVNMLGAYAWYAQGTGTRTIIFTPHKACTDVCQSFQVILKEGDILTFPGDRWKVEVMEGGEDISVAFLGFMLP